MAAAGCVWITICVSSFPIERAAAFEYVQNGSFEFGTSPWRTVGDGSFDSVDATTAPVGEGSYAARLTLEGSAITLRQSAFADVPPGSYRVSSLVRVTSASTRMFVRASTISPSTSFRQEFAPAAPNEWQLIAFDFLVPEFSQVNVEVGAQGSSGDVVYVDDVRFEGAAPVAPPDTPSTTPHTTDTALPATATLRATRTSAATRTPAPTATPPTGHDAIVGTELRNGGFEEIDDSGIPAAWQKYGGVLSESTSAVRTGSRAGLLESSTASTKWAYQTVMVEPDSAHAFSAWVNAEDANVAEAYLRISWYATDDGSGTSIGSSDSTEHISPASGFRLTTTGVVAAPSGAHSAKLRIVLAPASAAPARIFIDDASFEVASIAEAQLLASRSAGGPSTDTTTPQATRSRSGNTSRGAPSAATSNTKLVINEVMYDPDARGSDAEGEWIELFNAGMDDIDLNGWSVTDNGGTDALPAFVLRPLQYVVVAASDRLRTTEPKYDGSLLVVGGSVGNSLGNAGDRLTLKDSSGAVADAISWGTDATILDPAIDDVPAGHSIERRVAGADTDSAEDFVDNVRPSPGGPYEPPSLLAQGSTAGTSGSLESSRGDSVAWLPWGAVGVSGLAFALTVAWHALPLVRRKLHRSG